MVNRPWVSPVGPEYMQTYQIVAPVNTHWRPAKCDEYECDATVRGWKTVIDERTELGMSQGHFIRKSSGRSFKESRRPDGLTEFVFAAGQHCFAESTHRIRVDREDVFIVRGGDHRGNPRRTPPLIHKTPELWVEDFQENQDKIITARERG